MPKCGKHIFAALLLGVSLALCSCGETPQNVINLRLESFALVLNPLKIADIESLRVASLLYEPLVAVNQEGHIEGRLAASWRHLDEHTMEFVIKDGVTFSNGQPVRARDVVATLCAAMQPTSPWSWALASIKREAGPTKESIQCTGLLEINERTVRIIQTKPVDWLLYALDGPPGWIVPQGAKEGEYSVLPGTGPYQLGAVVPDVRVELNARQTGSPTPAGVAKVIFQYIPDAAKAIQMFMAGELDVLSLTSPLLVNQLTEYQADRLTLKTQGNLISVPADRIRIAIINEASLAAKGYSAAQVAYFKAALNAGVDRKAIAGLTNDVLAEPLFTAYPPMAGRVEPPSSPSASSLPPASLTILTEPDAYSDMIAATVSKSRIDGISLNYRAIDKGLLINALVERQYDIATILLDANIHSPTYWASFFTPGSPFTLFGKPLTGLEKIDVETAEGQREAATLIDREGNWASIVKERHLIAVRPGISGLRLTPSGQLRYADIRKAK